MNYIYLHGFLSGPDSKKGLFLKARFEKLGVGLHLPDLNHGNFTHITITSQLKVVSSLTHKLPGDKVLIGSSLGGYLAALSAMKFPQIRKLVLIAPAFGFIPRYLKRLTREQREEWKRKGFIKLFHYHHQEQRLLAYDIVKDAAKYQDLEIQNSQPSLLIHGLQDESVPYRESIEYASRHAGAELLLLPADHGMLDKLEIIWNYMKIFLKLEERM
ncbi:MAG: alpha/beta fold hydrolase [Calditrichaeota bacterium]|nr:MAG: alpha/beta fold hydrolase [Calditrichota bacterium]